MNEKTQDQRPTDLELMQLADGELDDARRAEIEAFWERDAPARRHAEQLFETMGLAAHAVREHGGPKTDVDVVDDVLARIDSPADEATDRDEAGDEATRGDESAPQPAAKVVPLRARVAGRREARERRRQADSSRTIFALVAVAVAAAAGITVWGKIGNAPPNPANSGEVVTRPEIPTEATAKAVESVASNGTQAPEVDDDEPGVEVGSLEFGAGRSGTVLRVADDGDGAQSIIVWVRED